MEFNGHGQRLILLRNIMEPSQFSARPYRLFLVIFSEIRLEHLFSSQYFLKFSRHFSRPYSFRLQRRQDPHIIRRQGCELPAAITTSVACIVTSLQLSLHTKKCRGDWVTIVQVCMFVGFRSGIMMVVSLTGVKHFLVCVFTWSRIRN